MSWSGGVYTKGNAGSGGWAGDAAAGIGIEAGRHDTQDNDFATGINQCLNKDGSNAATGNLNLNSNKINNLAAATSRGDAAQTGQVQDGSFIWLGTTGGTATAQTATTTPALTAYAAGQKFRMITGFASTGATVTAHTLNINGLGAKNITNQDNTDLTAGSFTSGAILEVVYDGFRFKMTNDAGGWQTWTPSLALNSGTVSSLSVLLAKYKKSGKTVNLVLNASFNTTAGNPYLEVTGLPVNLATSSVAYHVYPNFAVVGGATTVGQTYNNSVSNLGNLRDQASTSWGTATGSTLRWNIIYEAV